MSESISRGHENDLISRRAAIDKIDSLYRDTAKNESYMITGYNHAVSDALAITKSLPSAQPEQHTCVNCGRTVNNGGWYADGRTRCPIEEHYALPKDGYCHLWEKRSVTDDDYPERRTDDCKDNV